MRAELGLDAGSCMRALLTYAELVTSGRWTKWMVYGQEDNEILVDVEVGG